MSEPACCDSARPEESAAPKRQLTLFDSSCIIVGIIIGAGIYKTAPLVANAVGGPWKVGGWVVEGGWWTVILIWLVGGLLSLFGALAYAELATAYPREGGDYVYLTRAYGRWAGFLFGWVQLSVVRPGDITLMAFAFGTYAITLYDPLANSAFPHMGQVYACAAVAILTAINVLGVQGGKWTQNLLTVAKAIGLMVIVVVAFIAPRSESAAPPASALPWSLALILVMFTFGGWNEMAYVAAEVKDPKRNIVRALVLGTVFVTALYLLLNTAFLYTLGYEGLAGSEAVANDAVSTAFPEIGSRLISVLVCVSALGAVNGLIFTGARISYAIGADHRAFRPLGKWDQKTGTPLRALIVQGILAIVLIIALASFGDTIIYTAGPVYLFYLATNFAVFVLRRKEPNTERPYRVSLYPVTTLIFCAVCGYLIYSAVTFRPWVAAAALGILLAGLPIYWFTKERS